MLDSACISQVEDIESHPAQTLAFALDLALKRAPGAQTDEL
jgi:hypothetical protein